MKDSKIPTIMTLPIQIQRHVTQMAEEIADALYWETLRRMEDRRLPVKAAARRSTKASAG